MRGYLPHAAWLGSGYKGSREAAVHVLGRLTCEQLASAWVIMPETLIDINFDIDILTEAGLFPDDHYQLVGSGRLPFEIKPREFIFLELLFLKPMPEWADSVEPCRIKRGERAS